MSLKERPGTCEGQARLLLEIDIRELLAVVIADDIAGVQFRLTKVAGSGRGICLLQIPQTAKPSGGRLTDGFAFVPQDRCRCPPFPHAAFGRVVELGSFGFTKAPLGKVTLMERLFCDVASSGLA